MNEKNYSLSCIKELITEYALSEDSKCKEDIRSILNDAFNAIYSKSRYISVFKYAEEDPLEIYNNCVIDVTEADILSWYVQLQTDNANTVVKCTAYAKMDTDKRYPFSLSFILSWFDFDREKWCNFYQQCYRFGEFLINTQLKNVLDSKTNKNMYNMVKILNDQLAAIKQAADKEYVPFNVTYFTDGSNR